MTGEDESGSTVIFTARRNVILGCRSRFTHVREKTDPSKLTVPRGFDNQEPETVEIQGTMQEFLRLPERMKYDLTDSDRMVRARTLAFSDAERKEMGRRRGMVPDKEKFPVGKGGGGRRVGDGDGDGWTGCIV